MVDAFGVARVSFPATVSSASSNGAGERLKKTRNGRVKLKRATRAASPLDLVAAGTRALAASVGVSLLWYDIQSGVRFGGCYGAISFRRYRRPSKAIAALLSARVSSQNTVAAAQAWLASANHPFFDKPAPQAVQPAPQAAAPVASQTFALLAAKRPCE